jgi:hypothetical protein
MVEAVADFARCGGVADLRDEPLCCFINGDEDRRCQAALSRAAERRVRDDLCGHVHVGVGQDDDGVLRSPLTLHPLAVCRRTAVHVARDPRRAHERNSPYLWMVQQRVDSALTAVHQIDHAWGEAG